jgi:hypothetical protein
MRGLLTSLFVVLWATVGAGQVVTNPTTVQFDPSSDHNAVNAQGQPVVVRYDLYIYPIGATDPGRIMALGKPAPGSDGTIQVDFSVLTTWPLPDGTYQARVVAVGQASQGQSDLSNVFAFSGGGSGGSPPPMKPTNVTAAIKS